jgi:hypothetical protein
LGSTSLDGCKVASGVPCDGTGGGGDDDAIVPLLRECEWMKRRRTSVIGKEERLQLFHNYPKKYVKKV